jgi:hypothetical protein
MTKVHQLLLALACVACTNAGCTTDRSHTMHARTITPKVESLTSAPLRNRLRLVLDAPLPRVWSLVGDLARFPEYSSGLERVDVKKDEAGHATEYVCHFKPQGEGGAALAHREVVRWYVPAAGFASQAEEPNAFGLINAVTLVTVRESTEGTIVVWEQYYDAADVAMNEQAFEQALADIGERLVAKFGGRIVELRR